MIDTDDSAAGWCPKCLENKVAFVEDEGSYGFFVTCPDCGSDLYAAKEDPPKPIAVEDKGHD